MTRRAVVWLTLLLAVGLIFIGLALIWLKPAKTTSISQLVVPKLFGSHARLVTVTRVVDGDTIEVKDQGKVTKLRYIGIDTPETVDPHRPVGCFGHEASVEDKQLVEGQTVVVIPDQEDLDKFGRLLRYVYLPVSSSNWLFVNDYLVRQGFAIPDPIAPNELYASQFKQAAQEAQLNKRGLWAKCQLQ